MSDKFVTFKTCTTCKTRKHFSKFYTDKRRKGGLCSRCIKCERVAQKGYREKNKSATRIQSKVWYQKNKSSVLKKQKVYYREKKKQNLLLAKYGITLEDYEQMFLEQNGCCAMCGQHESKFRRNLCVDHDHETGRVRGLLCDVCNLRLGYLENIEFVTKAKLYLITH